MKKIYTVLMFLALCAMPEMAWAQMEKIGIAAIVNDDIITTSDVEGRYALGTSGVSIQPTPEQAKELRRQALDALIDEQIRLQEAFRIGSTPTAEQIDEAFANMAAQNRVTPEQFKQGLESKPYMYQSLMRQIKTQIAWSEIIRKRVRPKITITEEEISAYIAEQDENPAKSEYRIAEIFLKNDESNKVLANRILAEMADGKQRFSTMAHQFSQGLEASKGGLLGWIPENSLDPVLNEAIMTMEPGGVSKPIVSTRGLHILMLLEKRDILAAEVGSQRVGIKQVTVMLPPNAPEELAEQALKFTRSVMSKANDCDGMDALIKEANSPLSRDLGVVRLADLPPPVVKTVRDLPIGKVSEPIRASDGFVLYMVCSREDNAAEMVREDAANALGTERLSRLQQRYYRDLRAAAYVDIKTQF